jgi:hypothetical protein
MAGISMASFCAIDGMVEEWRPVPGYEGLYEGSTTGSVASLRDKHGNSRRKILKQFINEDGYWVVNLCGGGKRKSWLVHRLVAKTFLPNPHGYSFVCHRDDSRQDNRSDNLYWGTDQMNKDDAVRHGLMERGERRYNVKLTEVDVREIRRLRADAPKKWTYKMLTNRFGVSHGTLWAIVHIRRWRHVT